VLLTKSDKLTRAESTKALSIAKLQAGGGQAKLFSALKKQGVDDLAQLMWDWTHEEGDAKPSASLENIDNIEEGGADD
jgi:GTP-binding protein